VAWLATKMADETVCFSGSTAEEVEQAKIFWKSINPPVKPKSALIVTGIDHRLRTASKPQNGKSVCCLFTKYKLIKLYQLIKF
jgi:hypothetical protein